MKIYDLIVVGAGPAGIFAAISAAEDGAKVLLLEKNKCIGKKLRIAGQGKCNLTNSCPQREFYTKYGENGRFLKSAFNSFSPEKLKEWFEKRGLPLILIEDKGKYFPKSLNGEDVIKILNNELKKNEVVIETEMAVADITNSQGLFEVKSSLKKFYGKKIVLTTGGFTYPALGSTGDGYLFAKNFGHKINVPYPCLTPVYVESYPFSEISGISFKNISIILIREGINIQKTQGDVLLTHHNFSGPGIIDFSRYVRKGDLIVFNFMGIAKEKFLEEFQREVGQSGKKSIKNFLLTFNMPERFIKKILALQDIDENKKICEITKNEKNRLSMLTGYQFRVTRLGGVEIAMATSGGVSLEEVNNKTMESKKISGLYFAGEVLDIDGDTGGFNIQAAISTGYLAGKSIKELKK